MIGRTIGGYQVLEQIGMGGMATVYRAYDPSTDRFVALKTLPQQYSKDPQFVERFRREARAIAKLEHLHILPLFAYGEDDGVTYLVMRYLPAGTLSERIRQMGQMPLEEAARLLAQIASALDHAHANNILHRDIKPSNILIDQGGNAYLTDFGIARIVEGTLDLTGDSVLGTPQYMSPEQCEGRKDLTAASDLYSLGVVLYEMVTGRTPFQAETPLAVIHMQIMGTAMPPPGSLREDLPEAAEAVILKSLARDPENRYSSCAALSKAFNEAIKEPARTQPSIRPSVPERPTVRASVTEPISDSPTTRLPRSGAAPRGGISGGGTAAGIILALVIVAGIIAFLIRPTGEMTDIGTVMPATITAAAAQAATETVIPEAATAEITTEATTVVLSSDVTELVAQGDAHVANFEYDKALEAYNSALLAAPENPEILLKRAQTLQNQGDATAALADYQRVTELDPSRSDVHKQIGDLYRSQGQYDEALASYTQAVESGSTDSQVYSERGNLYSGRAEGENALADLDKAIELDPSNDFAFVYRGTEYTRQGDYEAALNDFTQALRLDENEVWAYRGRATVFRLQGDLTGALADLNKALELTPDDSGLLLLHGQINSEAGNSNDALEDFTRAIGLSSDYLDAYIARAREYAIQGNPKLALGDYNRAIELQPDNADLYAARGLTYRDMDDLNNALVDYRQALKLTPNNPQLYADRATVYQWKGDPEKAIADLDKAIEIQTDFVAAYIQRAENHTNLGNYEDALADYLHARALDETSWYSYRGPVENLITAKNSGLTVPGYDLDAALKDADRAVELQPEGDVGVYAERAQIYMFRLEHDKAISDLTRAIQMVPDDEVLFRVRGQEYLALNDTDKAIADLTEAIRLNSNNTFAYSARGNAYEQDGQHEKALADWDKALELDISNGEAYKGRIAARLAIVDAGEDTNGDALANALTDATAAAQYAGGDPEVYLLRAQVYSRMGEIELAINDNTQVLAMAPDNAQAYIQRALNYHAQKNDEFALSDLQKAIELEPTAPAYEALGEIYYESGQTAEALEAYQQLATLVGEDNLSETVRTRLAELKMQPTATPA